MFSDVGTPILNRHGWPLRWPRAWITLLGIIQLPLGVYIAGLEVGHTLFDVHRSTAFVGFIIFPPLVLCAIFVLITACRPKPVLLRIATILCCVVILLCILLIVYDILVLIDPTRCFLLSCSDASVTYAVNTTYNITVTGWPLQIDWPDAFRSAMNTKRFLQGAQLLCACLLILFCSLYLATYLIYRHFNHHRPTANQPSEKTTLSSRALYVYPEHAQRSFVSVYDIDDCSSSSVEYDPSMVAHQFGRRQYAAPRLSLTPAEEYQICRRCMTQPREISTGGSGRDSSFSYTCTYCRNELANEPAQVPVVYQITVPLSTSC